MKDITRLSAFLSKSFHGKGANKINVELTQYGTQTSGNKSRVTFTFDIDGPGLVVFLTDLIKTIQGDQK